MGVKQQLVYTPFFKKQVLDRDVMEYEKRGRPCRDLKGRARSLCESGTGETILTGAASTPPI